MKTISVTKARSNLYKLLDDTKSSGEPIQITGKRTNGVLISEDDWRAIRETLFLVSIPGMRESIRDGLNTPISECETEIKW
jgi:antitoxin YefM